jgi:predicted DCC family thiol-disulfide oxidoreductase YuxK
MATHATGGTNGRAHVRASRASLDLSTTRVLVREREDAPLAPAPWSDITQDHEERSEWKRGPAERLRAFWLGETDLAPLGLFRIAFGMLLFNWVWQLYPNISAFFTDEGMLPRSMLVSAFPLRFTLLNVAGDWWTVFLFWLVGLGVAVMLTVGYRTRTACVLALLVLLSFQWRNPFMLDGSDFVFRLVPLWLIFAAAGNRFSVDAAIRRSRGDAPSPVGPALPVRILEIQVAWIYLTTGLEKAAGSTWWDGTAAYYALQLKHTFGRSFAEPLALNPFFQTLVSWNTLAVELLFLPLVFLPILHRQGRIVAIAGAAMLHLGILLLMNVGNFPMVMLAALILFLPPDLVNRLVTGSRRLFPRSEVRLYYDGACHFCRRTVAFLSALDIYETVTPVDFRAINPSKAGLGALALEKRIHAIDEQGRIAEGFAAIARAARAIPLLFPLAIMMAIPGVSRVAERIYDWLAERRFVLLSCPGGICALHPTPIAASKLNALAEVRFPWPRRVGYGLLAVTAIFSFATALPDSLAAFRPTEPATRVLTFLSLDQRWNMFSPNPANTDGWMLAPARLADGTELDLLTGGPVSDEPRYADSLYTRWTKVTERISNASYANYRVEYGRMFCRLRNFHLREGESPLATFEIYYIQRIIPAPGQGEPTLHTHHIWSHTC